ncbi:Hypothetical protein CINCED_3A023948 [Cinara cedri]|uniref:Uncharacterized protein n=1 Tax=Cinara cedri TaxID=506608 RepID=A0A5E4MDK7_9HEMI|nr:Hypothetical protein CINCED_3A023948 [Cinara cedri]
MATLRTATTTEFRKRVYFDGSPTHVFNDKFLTPLMKACMYGRSEQVRLILEEKPLSVIERDGVFKTALHYCAENDEEDADCAKLLLEVDPSIVDIPDEDGHTALHLAVIAGNLPLVRFLLVSGHADPNKRDAEGHSTIHWATVCADVDALELVLSHGGTTKSADVHGGYAIHYAAQMCGTGICRSGEARTIGVRVLQSLLSYGADVHVTDKHGRQPILWAASAGSADAIITLINGGANVESHDKDGLTALHCAASRGHVECVDGLLTLCGSEVDAVDSNSCSALFYAVTLGHADATEILLEHGANPDRKDGKGRTPAHCGAFKGQLETVRLLADHGANLWLRNSKGGYPLHDAMRSGRKDLVLWLISMRPESVDYYDDDGKRPLHIAALNNNLEMSKIILDNGASINPVMKIKGERLTPLDVALRKNNGHLAKFLHLYGGKPASKLIKTFSKQQSTVRVKTKRSESRRNSHSSDSISRKYRNGVSRKKQVVQRKGESPKPNKTSKSRLVQVHIRADVMTKTIGKSRSDKKSYCSSTFPKTFKKKSASINEPKECFSENDLCYGEDYDCDYDYDDEYEDDVDDDDEENLNENDEEYGDSLDRQLNGGNKRRNMNRLRGNRTATQCVKRELKMTSDGRRRRINRDKAAKTAANKVQVMTATNNKLKQGTTAANKAEVTISSVPTGVVDDGSNKHEDEPNISHIVCSDEHDAEQPKTTTGNVLDTVKESVNLTFTDNMNKDGSDGDNQNMPEAYVPSNTVELDQNVNDSVSSQPEGGSTKNDDSHLTPATETNGISLQPALLQSQPQLPQSQLPHPQPEPSTVQTIMIEGPPTTVTISKRTPADRVPVKRSVSNVDGKTSTGRSINCKAIVEVLDRVNTPQLTPVMVGGAAGDRNTEEIAGKLTAFSVLPTEGRDDDRTCECPNCRKKSLQSISKKNKSRIPRLNNYCSLAPTSDLNTMSVTKAVQLSSRKYHLERLIFYQLSELKRLQIRAGKSDERVLVKRLVEEYGRTGLFTGLKRYDGPFSFKRFEKYLYDQLLVLQKSLTDGKTVIPAVQPIDEVEKLTGALRRINVGKTVLENPNDYCFLCTQTTNRCFHATHAYTGIPCAAYSE